MVHNLLGRFRTQHLVDPAWARVASGGGERALENTGIVLNDAIVACARAGCIHELCEAIYQQEVGGGEPGRCIPMLLARDAVMAFDVLASRHPDMVIEPEHANGVSLVTFCALAGRVSTLERLDTHMHLLGSCVRWQSLDQPLYACCYSGLPASAAWLLGHGFDPNEKGEKGRGLLHRLAEFGHYPPHPGKADKSLAIIGLLLAHGADPRLQDDEGRTCLDEQGWTGEQIQREMARRSRGRMQRTVARTGDKQAVKRL